LIHLWTYSLQRMYTENQFHIPWRRHDIKVLSRTCT
jgi:hypothetical protein